MDDTRLNVSVSISCALNAIFGTQKTRVNSSITSANRTDTATATMPAANVDQYALTEEQKQHWLEHGFIKLEGCFSREAAEKFTSSLWTRLGASPEDKSTWLLDKLNMPGHTAVPAKDFAPKAYYAIAELVGGEDRIADWCKLWKDGWIVNFGRPEYSPDDPLDLRKLDGWHSDGDWFRHYLDSPEQAMLIIPLFSDIESKGGATAICTDGIGLVAKELVCIVASLYVCIYLCTPAVSASHYV